MKRLLEKRGLLVADLGADHLDATDDYPDYAEELGRKVSESGTRGILLCGNAVGVCIAANKIRGIRAGIGYSTYAAKTMRTDDDTNVLCLPGRALTNAEVERIVTTWLKTPFSGAERHKRRLRKLVEIERRK